MIIEFRINARLGDKAELGAIGPFIFIGLLLATLSIDLIIQFIVFAFMDGRWKMLWLTEILIIVVLGVLMMDTVHYGD